MRGCTGLGGLEVTDAIYYVQDYGGPIGLRLATAHPERVRGLVVQNANAYMEVEGLTPAVAGAFMPLWQHGDDTGARQMLLAETTRMQYTAGARHPEHLNPDAWVLDQAQMDRPGSAERQMALFRDYQHNVPLFDVWQAYFRTHQPKTLVAWGRGDPFFGAPGAEAFRRDLKEVRVELLDSGHFALEEDAARSTRGPSRPTANSATPRSDRTKRRSSRTSAASTWPPYRKQAGPMCSTAAATRAS